MEDLLSLTKLFFNNGQRSKLDRIKIISLFWYLDFLERVK